MNGLYAVGLALLVLTLNVLARGVILWYTWNEHIRDLWPDAPFMSFVHACVIMICAGSAFQSYSGSSSSK